MNTDKDHRAVSDGLARNSADEVVTMRPMEFEDGRKGWYVDHPEFFCDIEPDAETGAWSVFFRDKQGREGFAEHNAAPVTEWRDPDTGRTCAKPQPATAEEAAKRLGLDVREAAQPLASKHICVIVNLPCTRGCHPYECHRA